MPSLISTLPMVEQFSLYKGEKLELVEIFQNLDIKFCLLNKDNKEVTFPAKCRDFFIDSVLSRLWREEVEVYGMSYDFTKSPYDVDNIRMSLKFPDLVSRNNVIKQIHILNEWEREAGLAETKLFRLPKKFSTHRVMVIGDKQYLSDSWKISFFSLMLKFLSFENFGKDSFEPVYPESDYWDLILEKGGWETIKSLLSMVENLEDNIYLNNVVTRAASMYDNHSNRIVSIHDNGGVMKFLKNDYEKIQAMSTMPEEGEG